MGHHAGLADFDGGQGSLSERLEGRGLTEGHLQKALAANPPAHILSPCVSSVKDVFKVLRGRDPSFLIRMLFSCLVDADFLDTEAYMTPQASVQRNNYPALGQMKKLLQEHVAQISASADNTPVNTARREVLEQCEEKASACAGYFSLIVPTGGGKTLSSLAFAMAHACYHDKKRIIYAIPYTSIIEQTAQVFRDVFAPLGACVVEHHSNFDDGRDGQESTRRRLAAENWDAPLIVTTTVQLFESLYAARTGRCRKLHNIANSVIILDEAHLIPPDMRTPILKALHELVAHYGVTVVLCTATPTGIEELRAESKHVHDLVPIVKDADALYARLKRVNVEARLTDVDVIENWSVLADELAQYPQVLCIVNRRQDCRDLHAAMPKNTIHLSALMCAEHRSKVIKDIKEKLKRGEPVHVISTQLVEAGVDIDFPVVYRAMAGLDSIAQAAGRCNREGKLKGEGRLVIFRTAKGAPRGIMRRATDAADEVLRNCPDGDILSPDMQKKYFKLLYGRQEGDRDNFLNTFFPENQDMAYRFREGAEAFRMIKDVYKPVIVRYDDNEALLEKLKQGKPDKWLLRKLQRYTVSLPEGMVLGLLKEEAITEAQPNLYVQNTSALYNKDIGFVPEYGSSYASADLIA